MKPNRMKTLWALISVLACCLFPTVLRTQVDRGTINGTISDPSGAVIPGVHVTATNVETGVVTEGTSNSVGFYSIRNLPVGKYGLKIRQGRIRPSGTFGHHAFVWAGSPDQRNPDGRRCDAGRFGDWRCAGLES